MRKRNFVATALLFALCAGLASAAEESTIPTEAIAAMPLRDALDAFAAHEHLRVVYVSSLVEGLRSHGTPAGLTRQAALQALLEGTGLQFRFIDDRTVILLAARKPAQTDARVDARDTDKGIQKLKPVTVLGSLIPRAQIETASPLLVITSEQMKDRGFSSVADALQNLSLNTGAAFNNTSISGMGGSTWATKSLSLFGLPPDYVKFLINGRPMAQYSQIVDGAGYGFGATPTDTFVTNLAGIPIDLVDHIEILSGGQSSLYGSDAIAGVINIVLRQHANYASVDAQYGYYTEGGGKQWKLSVTDGLNRGGLDLVYGVQLNKQEPVYAIQRRYTTGNFAGNPLDPQQPAVVLEIFNLSGPNPVLPGGSCAGLGSLFHNSVALSGSPNAPYCGSVIGNSNEALITGSEAASANAHLTYHFSENIEFYGDFFDTYQKSENGEIPFWSPKYYDVNLQKELIINRSFAPAEVGANPYGTSQGRQYENQSNVALGTRIQLDSGWNLDVHYSRSNERTDFQQYNFTANSVATSYGAAVFGPLLGYNEDNIPEYSPNYNVLFQPITPAQYRSYIAGGDLVSTMRTDEWQAKLTQAALFALPGGSAGLAVLAEGGYESWKYLPSEAFLDAGFEGNNFATSSLAHRHRYATAVELTLPVFKQLTIDASARYDAYDVEGHHFEHPTRSLGLEYRPLESLLLRAKYTTSFKAPELVQEFEQLEPSRRNQVIDYAGCYQAGISIDGCNTAANISLSTGASAYPIEKDLSNPALQAVRSKSFSYGFVWSPNSQFSASLDYQHLYISDQIAQQTAQNLLNEQLDCLEGIGGLTAQSPTCVALNSQITRSAPTPDWPLGTITKITTLQYNIANSVNNSLTANLHYGMDLGFYGKLNVDGVYTLMLADRTQNLPGDPYLSEFRYPVQFGLLLSRVKSNLSINWNRTPWNVTLYFNYIGHSPNYIATTTGTYEGTTPYGNPGHLPPWLTTNLSVSYSPIPSLTLSLRFNNLMDSMPPLDRTQSGETNLPFNPAFYNPYGRQVLVDAKYTF